MRTEQICMACHILHYGVISDIEEYFLLFFYQILPVHDSVSNLWNSRSITIISLPPVRPVRTAAAADRGPASSSCWPIALLAESGCRSTASVHLQGNKVYSLWLSMTFFMFFFSILLSLQIGSSDNIHPLFTCFSPWSLIITFLLSLLYHYIWYTYTTHAVGIKLCRDDSKHVFINKELLSLLNKS